MRVPVRITVMRHYFRLWHHLENKTYPLNDDEVIRKKILYEALDTLTDADRNLLELKYNVAERPHKSDKEMAEKSNITLKDYRKQRVKIEDKLRFTFKKVIDKYQHELDDVNESTWPRSQRKRLTKYYLNKWYHYDTNYNSLSEREVINMRILYTALKALDEHELNFIASKYRTEIKKNDQLMAGESGMTDKVYINNRVQIEDKLSYVVEDNHKLHEDEINEIRRL